MTIRDIAKMVGVGKSTVSRVLSGSGCVNAETRKRIEQVMAEHNYTPSAFARSLSTNDTNTIGVVIPEINNPFFGEIISGISVVADANNITLIFCNTDNLLEKEYRALRMLKEYRVKGLIFTTAFDECDANASKQTRDMLDDLGVPVVLVDRPIAGGGWDSVVFDNKRGSYEAVRALIQGGNRDIGIITGNAKSIVSKERLSGYIQALEEAHIPIHPERIYVGDSTTQTAYEITKNLIEKQLLPEAMYVCNNLSSQGFIKALFEEHIKLGKDICYVGFDPVPALDIVNIAVSHIERNAVEMGFTAMKMLLDCFQTNEWRTREHIIPSKLVLNGTESRK